MTRESMKVTELIPHVGLKVILLKLFLAMISSFPTDSVTACIGWIFSWRMRMRVKPLEQST